MLNQSPRSSIANPQRGLSNVEMIPVLLLFALLFNFTLGFFGVVHSGILQNIAARNYAFETFRNRSNLNRFRPQVDINNAKIVFNRVGFRYHSVRTEGGGSDTDSWFATARPIRFIAANQSDPDETQMSDHSLVNQIKDPGKASDVYTGEDGGLDTVWVKVIYGICVTHNCQAITP